MKTNTVNETTLTTLNQYGLVFLAGIEEIIMFLEVSFDHEASC